MTDSTPITPEPEPPFVPTEPRHHAPLNIPAISIAAAVGLVLGIGGTLGVQAATTSIGALVPTPTPTTDTRLQEAYTACSSPEGMVLGDGGATITIDVKGNKDYSGAPYSAEACVLRHLGAPTSVTSHIEQTTAMDGRQTESWNGITIEWSYHPDRGPDMVVKLDKP